MLTRTFDQYRDVFFRFGYLGVMFFTIKGMLWLILPVVFTLYLN